MPQSGVLEDPLCLFGCPVSTTGGLAESDQVLRRTLYALQNNPDTKFADWVAYRVAPENIGPTQERCWKADPELPEADTLEPEDYTGAYAALTTDRGHQAPLASFTSHAEWASTNYLWNVTPQNEALNRGPWLHLDSAVRDAASQLGPLYVVTGPLYEAEMPALPGADEPHRVPSGYWKVIATEDGEAVAFILEQSTPRRFDECEAVVSVDEVESRSGFDLFPKLDGHQTDGVGDGSLLHALGCQQANR